MPCKKWTGKEIYKFCTNSNYYESLIQYIKDKNDDVGKEHTCDNLSTNMTFFTNSSSTKICQEFKLLYKSFSIFRGKEISEDDIFSDYDCDFLNYWLNNKLKENVNNDSIMVKELYEEIRSRDEEFFTKNKELDDYMRIVDPDILENMKLLYNLHDNAVKIMSIIRNEFYINEDLKNEAQKSCSQYTKECDENYKKAMDRCLYSNADFYNALKNFKDGYDIMTKPSSNKSNACNSSEFYYFPEYDALLEKKANAIKISSTLFLLSLALPLIYKYTPFGPFLRTKINMVKDWWINPDKNGGELLSTYNDTEDNNSENVEYNIGYYSETN
ncbi:PIR Superfamily Protein [Plasmodium ovale wallikeri]|uniref:PIR Superfamily Protein n=1 Tax=Plasmodium ovale wallikeri TaxID=864142 RepID=A0A1A9ALU1_PLAOA|nr:PIR Superfamily Protein [Plasmodium ovale wallikeri]SBT57737.1 PIR Superfamily Protein [Plasmodium ovale wallikeri]